MVLHVPRVEVDPISEDSAMSIVGLDGLSNEEIREELERGARFVVFEYCISIIVLTFKRSSAIHFVRSDEGTFGKGLRITDSITSRLRTNRPRNPEDWPLSRRKLLNLRSLMAVRGVATIIGRFLPCPRGPGAFAQMIRAGCSFPCSRKGVTRAPRRLQK